MSNLPALVCIALSIVSTGCSVRTPSPTAPTLGDSRYLILDTARGATVGLDRLAQEAAGADVVFFGETHADAVAHDLERILLGEIGARTGAVVLGLEMFSRDAQPAIDDYLAGAIDRSTFVARAEPWPNYATAYEPLVELARIRGWRVVGTNLPQELATRVATEGIQLLDELPPEQRRFAAARNRCPMNGYWERFVQELSAGSAQAAHGATGSDERVRMLFEAQCARDEAMAEAISDAAEMGTLIFHVNGRFHSDYHQGIVTRLVSRRPDLKIITISTSPHTRTSTLELPTGLPRADYLIATWPPGS